MRRHWTLVLAMLLTWGCSGDDSTADTDSASQSALDTLVLDVSDTDNAEIDVSEDTTTSKDSGTDLTPGDIEQRQDSVSWVPGAIPELVAGDPVTVTSPGGIAIQPAVALDADQKSLLAFTGSPTDSTDLMIFGRRDAGEAFPLHDKDNQKRNEPAICALANGGFVVVWSVDTAGAALPALQIGFTVVDDNGPAAEKRVKTDREGNHWLAHVACTADGGFVIAGVRPEANDPSFEAFAQRYNAQGEPVDSAITLNELPDATESQPVVGVTQNTVWTAWSALEGSSWIRRAFTTETAEKVATTDSSGMALAADNRVLGAALALNVKGPNIHVHWLPETGSPSAVVSLDDDGAAKRHTAAIALLERADSVAIIYQTMEGKSSRMIVRYLGSQTSAPVAVSTGSFPPYTPTIAYRGGALVAAWTEPHPENQFAIQVRRW